MDCPGPSGRYITAPASALSICFARLVPLEIFHSVPFYHKYELGFFDFVNISITLNN